MLDLETMEIVIKIDLIDISKTVDVKKNQVEVIED